MNTKKGKVSELIPDDKNFNLGSEFGKHLIDKSLQTFGAGRSILADKNNRIIAGNKTLEAFSESGNEDIIIVETTGKQLVVVKRTDIDLDSDYGRELALADNATAKASIVFATDVIAEVLSVETAEVWGVKDYQGIGKADERELDTDNFSQTANSYLNNSIRQVVLYYDIETYKRVLEKLDKIGLKHGIEEDNSAVILKLLELYADENS